MAVSPSFASPEDAVRADYSPAAVVRIIAVKCSPSGRNAVVFIEHENDYPYEEFCERTGEGWKTRGGGSGGGTGWRWTHDDPVQGPMGVAISWEPPGARWDVPESEIP
jgi:hypothetical protein